MRYIFLGIIAGALIIAVAIVFSVAKAAPAYSVSYLGKPIRTAVPGKPFILKLQVKNTGTTEYSGVKVIVHVPDGISHSKVAPNDAAIHDDLIMWSDVPIAAGKSFYPSFTFTLDNGTPLKTKKNIWIEVIGDGMEANSANFSITAVKK